MHKILSFTQIALDINVHNDIDFGIENVFKISFILLALASETNQQRINGTFLCAVSNAQNPVI
jgi:hypothetical protein